MSYGLYGERGIYLGIKMAVHDKRNLYCYQGDVGTCIYGSIGLQHVKAYAKELLQGNKPMAP